MTDFGERIRRARKAAGLGQQELASRVGITQGTLSRIERGTIATSADVAQRLCDAIGVTYASSETAVSGVAERIRIALLDSGKSAGGASVEAGLSRSAIQDILAGNSASPRLDTLERLAPVLGVTINYLASGSDGPSPAPPTSRLEQAVEAAAHAFHENSRSKRQFHWESSSPEWRRDIRNFVRPMVEAALEAADTYMAAAIPKPKAKETR